MTEKEKLMEGWYHFCDRINFGQSALDADAIVFMNTFPTLVDKAIKEGK